MADWVTWAAGVLGMFRLPASVVWAWNWYLLGLNVRELGPYSLIVGGGLCLEHNTRRSGQRARASPWQLPWQSSRAQIRSSRGRWRGHGAGENDPQATAHLSRVEDFGEVRGEGVLLGHQGRSHVDDCGCGCTHKIFTITYIF